MAGITNITALGLKNTATTQPTIKGEIRYVDGTGFRAYAESGVFTIGSGGTGSSTFVGLTDTPANYTGSENRILKVNAGGTAVEFVTLSGDVTIDATGVSAITADSIINADVKTNAAIAWSKLAASTDISVTGTVTDLSIASEAHGDIIFFDGTNWVRLAPGSAGNALVTAGAAASPYWGAPSIATASVLANSVTCEAGANDYTLAFGVAGGAHTLTIPAVGGNRTFAFIDEAQSVSANQTFGQTNLWVAGGDANALNFKLNETLTGAKTLNVKVNDTDRTIDLSGNIALGGTLTTLGAWSQTGAHSLGVTTTGATTVTLPTSGTLSTLAGAETLETKTLTAPKIVTTGFIADGGGDEFLAFVESATPVNYVEVRNADTGDAAVVRGNGADAAVDLALYGKGTGKVVVCDSADPTKMVNFDASGATGTKTSTLTFAHSDDRVITFPDATDTLVGKATTDIFTNKTIDCDGTGNVITNVNANELDPITPAAASLYGVPFQIHKIMSNVDNAGTNIYEDNAPFAFQVVGVKSICVGGTGTWALHNGKVGALGTEITDVVTVAADKDIDYAASIDDAQYEIASGGSLVLVGDIGGAMDVRLIIDCIRV